MGPGLAGDATWCLGVMWFLTAVVFFFLMLRLYTRIICLASYGIDDHIYAVAFVFLLIFNVFIHIAGTYGYGQTMLEIGVQDHVVKATLYECIGQAFAIVGMSIAKASLGAFLLRLVVVQWHSVAIWIAMLFVICASIAQVLCFWLSCRPLDYVYNRFIPGYCGNTKPTSYILCVSTICCDFFYAIFPWVIVKNLQMPKREKITIGVSFSLGLIAAAAGIVRMTEVKGLYTENYLKDSVGLIFWSAVEMAVTLICIGIPVCRPAYRRFYHHWRPDEQTSGYRRQKYPQDDSSFALQTIGGGTLEGHKGKIVSKSRELNQNSKGRDVENGLSDDGESFSNVKIGGINTKTHVGRGLKTNVPNNASDEEILGNEYWRSQNQPQIHQGQQRGGGGIMVTETFRVERSNRS